MGNRYPAATDQASEYGIRLAAALAYLMIHQQDPVGLDHL